MGVQLPSERKTAEQAKRLAQEMAHDCARLYMALSRIEDGDRTELEWAGELSDAIGEQLGMLRAKLLNLGARF
jgi:hypothetical protein